MGDTREFLKQHTAAAHRGLDETYLVSALVAGTLAPPSYWGLLMAYQAFFSSWESRMWELHPEMVAELGAGRFEKSGWLAEDLAKLSGYSHGSSDMNCGEPEMPEDLAGLAGCLYVIEGSTLGGMHLSRFGPVFPNDAGRYFRGYGVETVSAWKSFIEWLEIQVTDDEGRMRAAETANGTFGWFQRAFSEAGENRR